MLFAFGFEETDASREHEVGAPEQFLLILPQTGGSVMEEGEFILPASSVARGLRVPRSNTSAIGV